MTTGYRKSSTFRVLATKKPAYCVKPMNNKKVDPSKDLGQKQRNG
jgi:hypothetical protein